MMNKLLLAIIAAGLWANVATSLVKPVQAQDASIGSIAGSTALIAKYLGETQTTLAMRDFCAGH